IRQSWGAPKNPNDKLDQSLQDELILPLGSTYQKLKNEAHDLKQATTLEYRWTGFLNRDLQGEITGRIVKEPTQPGPVFIMRAATDNPSKTDIITVGKWESGTLTLDENSSELNAGRPLFFLSYTD
ncbi:MAG: hypothetical protein ACR2NF_02330, partial [Pirellulales bacterium]